jgi:hypothetical protein
VSRAAKRILAKLKLTEFNSLEITEVIPKHFLGMPLTRPTFCTRASERVYST